MTCWLRATEAGTGRRTPAIALTAYAGADHRARALAAGYDAYATKPIDPDELCRLAAVVATRSAA